MGKKGLSLIEILVSCVILALVLTGLVNIFIAGKRHVLHSRSRMTAVELGRFFLDPLQMHARQGESVPGAQDDWDQPNNNLRVGIRYCDSDPTHAGLQQQNCPTQAERTLDGTEYSVEYNISAPFQPQSDMRKVVTSITWSERAP